MRVLKSLSARAAICRGKQLYGQLVLTHCFLKEFPFPSCIFLVRVFPFRCPTCVSSVLSCSRDTIKNIKTFTKENFFGDSCSVYRYACTASAGAGTRAGHLWTQTCRYAGDLSQLQRPFLHWWCERDSEIRSWEQNAHAWQCDHQHFRGKISGSWEFDQRPYYSSYRW